MPNETVLGQLTAKGAGVVHDSAGNLISDENGNRSDTGAFATPTDVTPTPGSGI